MKIFSEIKKHDKEVVFCALGEFGLSLYNFSNNLNFDHFAINDVPIDEELSDRLCQILNLVKLSFDNDLPKAISGINKFYIKSIPKELQNIDKKFVRLIKDKEVRDYLRKNKKTSEINMLNFYDKAKMIWDNTPEDFSMYHRYSEDYKYEICQAESMAKRYSDLGCDELCKNILDFVESTKSLMLENYMGFHRIFLKNASVILAKLNGYKLFRQNKLLKYEILCGKNTYKPKIYPLHELESIYTQRITELIFELENPSLFDYYMVLVPSVLNRTPEQDLNNIKNNDVIPVVIGEKDGKCYFLSYWR